MNSINIAFVGCGFVFDIYMRTIKAHPELNIIGVYDLRRQRLEAVSNYYGFRTYSTYEELLDDERIDIVINLTNIGSHFEVSKKALLAGKHVYSEKPLTKSLAETLELISLARAKGVRLYGAPCNVYSDTTRTLFKSVEKGDIGKPLLIYAELDDNPIHLMDFEGVVSPTGAPWPVVEEIHEGCTFEHVGYHLVWICALLGPAVSVTAFSSELISSKSLSVPGFSGTPDYSVACLHFKNGSSARITCSVVAPRDHRMRIIGETGELSADSYRHYQSPVHLENFTKRSLTARKFYSIRKNSILSKIFGIGGTRLKLEKSWKSHAVERDNQLHSSLKQKLMEWIRRKEVYAQDKLIGISEMSYEIQNDLNQYLSPDFIAHVNELTLIIQNSGTAGYAGTPATTFTPLGPIPSRS